MPKQTIITEQVTFDLLTPERQKEVLVEKRQINVGYDGWSDSEIDYWTEKLEEYGFNDTTIYFSGFHSQGDGACFDCKNINIEQYLKFTKSKAKYPTLVRLAKRFSGYDSLTCSITHSGRYYHENSCDLALYEEFSYNNYYKDRITSQTIDKAIKETALLEEQMEATRYNLCKEIYDRLYKVYICLTSDEEIAETLIFDEMYFDL